MDINLAFYIKILWKWYDYNFKYFGFFRVQKNDVLM